MKLIWRQHWALKCRARKNLSRNRKKPLMPPNNNSGSNEEEKLSANPNKAGDEKNNLSTKSEEAQVWADANQLTLDDEKSGPGQKDLPSSS